MRIQHNIMAMNAYRNYNNNTSALSKNLEKLSSGYKINRAGDDAAGLAISEKMRAQITGLSVAQKNAKDGISLVQTAEGALTEVHDMLNRMVELANQSANGTYDSTDRDQLQKEIVELRNEINRIADSANFNGIKLLDGTLTAQDLTVDGSMGENTISVVDGLQINQGQGGTGTKGEYTLNLDGLFSTGDTLEITFDDTTIGTSGKITLTYDSEIKGNTLEEQAQSIAAALSGDNDVNAAFDVTVDGTSIKLTSKVEGDDQTQVTGFTAKDATVTFGTKDNTTSKPGATGKSALTGAGWDTLFGNATGTGGADLREGDVLTFNFKGANGEDLVAELTVTKDMIGTDVKTTTENIVNALKNVNFKDQSGTVMDESKFKVSDFFTLTANTKADGTATDAGIGSIKVDGIVAGNFQIGDVTRTRDGGVSSALGTKTAGTAGAPADTDSQNIYALKAGTGNFSTGDKISLSGVLSDGRNFNLDLVAGTDFDIGADYDGTMDNLVAALTGGDLEITLNDGTTVKANEIFAADTSKEIQVTNTTGALKFTSAKKGAVSAGEAGAINNVSFTAGEGISATSTLTNGSAQTAATSSFTFSEGLEYGTAIEINGKTYELVQDERDTSNRNNIAIVVDDLTNTADIAQKFADAINAQEGGTDFTASVDGSTVTLTTTAVGSTVKATEVTTPYGESFSTVHFQLDPNKIDSNSYMSINGKTYAFLKEGDTLNANSVPTGATVINIGEDETAKSLADKLYAAANGKNAALEVAEDGTVTVKSLPDEFGVIAKPEVTFYDGLTLQIGDTSESFNQLSVNIKDCHADSLGIGNIDISNQSGAQAAVDVIKEAINFVSDVRGTLGATQNRLDHTINNLSVMEENIQDAESTIRDTDVADEMMAYTKNNILIQSAQAMLAQANQVPQGVLQLLQ